MIHTGCTYTKKDWTISLISISGKIKTTQTNKKFYISENNLVWAFILSWILSVAFTTIVVKDSTAFDKTTFYIVYDSIKALNFDGKYGQFCSKKCK